MCVTASVRAYACACASVCGVGVCVCGDGQIKTIQCTQIKNMPNKAHNVGTRIEVLLAHNSRIPPNSRSPCVVRPKLNRCLPPSLRSDAFDLIYRND